MRSIGSEQATLGPGRDVSCILRYSKRSSQQKMQYIFFMLAKVWIASRTIRYRITIASASLALEAAAIFSPAFNRMHSLNRSAP